jgi:hypothetical protein
MKPTDPAGVEAAVSTLQDEGGQDILAIIAPKHTRQYSPARMSAVVPRDPKLDIGIPSVEGIVKVLHGVCFLSLNVAHIPLWAATCLLDRAAFITKFPTASTG